MAIPNLKFLRVFGRNKDDHFRVIEVELIVSMTHTHTHARTYVRTYARTHARMHSATHLQWRVYILFNIVKNQHIINTCMLHKYFYEFHACFDKSLSEIKKVSSLVIGHMSIR